MAKKVVTSAETGGSAVASKASKPAGTIQREIPSHAGGMTPVPGSLAAAARDLTEDAIATRAYFIHLSGSGGSESENWLRAERELRAELGLL